VLDLNVQIEGALAAVELGALLVGTRKFPRDVICAPAVVLLAPIVQVALSLHSFYVVFVEGLNRDYFLEKAVSLQRLVAQLAHELLVL
jgi:hypothetical protein